MGSIRGSNGQLFRHLVTRGIYPVVVPRDSVYSGWDLAKLFHHKINRVLALLKSLYQTHATYIHNGVEEPLIQFCQPPHMRSFVAVARNSEAVAAFSQKLMSDRTTKKPSEYLTAPQLINSSVRGETVKAVLHQLYTNGATYEVDGERYRAVLCYAKGPKKMKLALDNHPAAQSLFAQAVIAYKKQRLQEWRAKINRGAGRNASIVDTLIANTNLDKWDINNLGHGFYIRVATVRRQMNKWNQQGYSFRRVMSWTQEGHKGESKIPWVVFKTWQREVELLKGIILLAEFCKDNHLNFHTEFAADKSVQRHITKNLSTGGKNER